MGEEQKFGGKTAGFLPRASALILDGIILTVLCVIVSIVIGVIYRSNPDRIFWLSFFFSIGIPAFYFTLATSWWGCTLGKKAFNLRVVNETGAYLGLPASFIRWLVSFIFAVPFGIGYFVSVFRPDGRDLPDLTARSWVLQVGPYSKAGFVLAMVVLPFLSFPSVGIIAAIGIPRFAQMLEKSREGATKGNLMALKSAISIYHNNTMGRWPANLEKDLVPKYIDQIPPVKATGAFVAKSKSPVGNKVTYATVRRQVPRNGDSGWFYDRFTGNIYVNSTVKDSKGVPYSFYSFE